MADEASRLAAAIKTISETYLSRLTAAVQTAERDAKIVLYSLRLVDYGTRLAALLAPKPVDIEPVSGTAAPVVVDAGFFIDKPSDEPYVIGGSPANPSGVTFSELDAIRWWTEVFTAGLNIGRVRSTLTPGSHVLTSAGYEAAVELGKASTDYAPAEFNPLDLEVIP